MRNTSHSSTAADLFQARQQLSLYQQQTEELNAELKKHHESSREQLESIEQLRNKLRETETVSGFIALQTECVQVYFDFVSTITGVVFFFFFVVGKKSRRIFHTKHK